MKILKKNSATNGFTLLETAIVVLIGGILTAGIISLLKNYQKKLNHERTLEAITNAQRGMESFFSSNTRYPCPADPTLLPTNKDYGRENCKLATVPGARDADGDGVNDPVLIGMFPIYGTQERDEDFNGNKILNAGEDLNGNGKLDTDEDFNKNGILDPGEDLNANGILNIPGKPQFLSDTHGTIYYSSELTDAWNNRLTYAVSKNLADPQGATIDTRLGAIRVIDEFGNDTGGTNRDAHYVILSHGKDGMGATSKMTGAKTPCDTANYSIESENCDNDSTFTQGLMSANTQPTTRYYDDYVDFKLSGSKEIWDKMRDSSGSYVESIRSLNAKNVGINTTTPTEKLDVNGVLRASSVIKADQICNTTPTAPECIVASSFYNIDCTTGTDGAPTGRYVKSVTRATDPVTGKPVYQRTCGAIEFAPAAQQTCPSGYIRYIRTNGTVICF